MAAITRDKPARTRESVERDATIPPEAKLVIEWLARQPAAAHKASAIGAALGIPTHAVTELAFPLRMRGLFQKRDGKRDLPLAEILLADDVRAAYAPTTKGAA